MRTRASGRRTRRGTGIRPIAAVAIGLLLGVGNAFADGSDGLVLRAGGFVRGRAEISDDQIRCEVPTVASAIVDGSFAVGLWNTYGTPTLFFPDPANPFGNPCGVWLLLRNGMDDQGVTVHRIDVRFRILNALRYRHYLAMRHGFATACRGLRTATFFVGARLEAGSSAGSSIAFVHLLPLVSPTLLACLREQFAVVSTDTMASLPLVASVTARATSDGGQAYRSNPANYTLALLHTCGNGRVDDGEECDPNAGGGSCLAGACANGHCTADANRACATNDDCTGTCGAPGTATECSCIY